MDDLIRADVLVRALLDMLHINQEIDDDIYYEAIRLEGQFVKADNS